MTPAVVTIHAPGYDEVLLPLWRAAYTPEQARYHIKGDDFIAGCLASAEEAHAAGNPAAPLVAARLLRARPDLAWPRWLVDAVIAMMERAPGTAAGGGRHTYPWTQWRDDAADYLRYRAVELLVRAEVPHVYDVAVERLRADGGKHASGVTPRAVAKAYDRVIARCGAPAVPYTMHYHPRYYPDIATLHALHAADLATA